MVRCPHSDEWGWCAQHGQNLVGRKEPIGADDGNRSETQGATVRGKPKEARSKLSTVGTRTGSEAGCGRRAGQQQRSPNVIKTHKVQPGGTRGKILHLTWGDLLHESEGEVSRGRSSEEGQ
jgi:hypothetical protein